MHNNQDRQTFMPPVGIETSIQAIERMQNYALDHTATFIITNNICEI